MDSLSFNLDYNNQNLQNSISFRGKTPERTDPFGTYTQDVSCGDTKIGTLEFPTYRKVTKGLEIKGGFKLDDGKSIKDSPCCCDEVRWIQVISTNAVLRRPFKVTAGFAHYIDPLNDRDPANDPFYWGTEEYRDSDGNIVPSFKVSSWQNRDGYDLMFYDRPSRQLRDFNPSRNWPAGAGDLTWTAQLALACVKHDDAGGGIIDYLAFVRYGFRISRDTGVVSLDPAQIETHGISQIFTTTVDSYNSGWEEGEIIGECCDKN